jgi:mono/diheme cytochrome c family protein
MYHVKPGTFRLARVIGPTGLLSVLCIVAPLAMANGATADPAAGDDHQQAVAALDDLKAAIAELVHADASYATDRNVYHRAAQRAINALSGTRGAGYAAAPGSPGDTAGMIGHIDTLLDRKATPVWATPLEGAETNVRAAVTYLQSAIKARELMDYQIAVSRAIAYLQVARGRPTEVGLFGGLEGALANTVLGVPADARQQNACEAPSAAPSYGTHGGYLAWVAVPASDGGHVLAEDPGGTELSVQRGMIVLHSAAANLVAEECGKHAEASPAAASAGPGGAQSAMAQVAKQTAPEQTVAAAPASGPLPALYTKAQAAAGGHIFATKCVSCHGRNLQGTAAPSVAGQDFLLTAHRNGWTLAIIRYIVFKLMPLNSPSSLNPADDANLMAFLLASNCYPSGTTAFPSGEDPAFANVQLGPVSGKPDGQNAAGVCKVE